MQRGRRKGAEKAKHPQGDAAPRSTVQACPKKLEPGDAPARRRWCEQPGEAVAHNFIKRIHVSRTQEN